MKVEVESVYDSSAGGLAKKFINSKSEKLEDLIANPNVNLMDVKRYFFII